VAFPFTVSDGVPGAGAGNLETKASPDEYTFSLPGTTSVYIDVQSCPTSISWQLKDSGGATVTSGSCSDKRVDNLAAGSYRLVFTPSLGCTGTYRVAVTAAA
jgi:hypothetical protein